MRTTLFLIFLLLLSESAVSIRINEIMAAPLADDSLNEWVEIYNNETAAVDLNGWVMGDSSDNDSIEGGLYGGSGTILDPGSYAIITDDATRVYNNFNVSSYALKLYIDDSSIGNGLSNSGETIYLYNTEKTLIHSVTYNSTDKGNTWAFFDGSWYEASPTPGYDNNGSLPVQQQNNGCDFSVVVSSNQTFFNSSGDFSFKIVISRISGQKSNITLFRQILNEYSEIEKSYSNITAEVTNSKTYQYSPNLDPGTYIIEAAITPECNDSDSENNKDSKMLVIRGNQQQNAPYITIEKLYDLGSDAKARYGQTVRAKVILYKGNSTGEAVEMWAEINGAKISKNTKVNMYDFYANYTLTLPLQLDPNCDLDYPGGSASLIIEGFGKQASHKFDIENITEDMCEYVEVENSVSEKAKKGISYSIAYLPDAVLIGNQFESSINIENNDDSPHRLEIWSYVYRGSKCYSGERESNKIIKYIDANSSQVVRLKNIVNEVDSGLYNFKVKILKDALKTPYEITDDIVLEERTAAAESANAALLNEDLSVISQNTDTEYNEKSELAKKENSIVLLSSPEIVYKSTTLKARSLTPYFFAVMALLLLFYLTMRKL